MSFIDAAGRLVAALAVALLTSGPALADRGDVPSPIVPVPDDVYQRSGPAKPDQQGDSDGGNLLATTYAHRSFLQEAAEGGLAEVELASLAPKRAQRSEVKRFAATLARDHAAANQKLQALAQRDGVTLPRTLDAQHQLVEERLKR